MKKVIALVLVLAMALLVVACNEVNVPKGSPTVTNAQPPVPSVEASAGTETAASGDPAPPAERYMWAISGGGATSGAGVVAAAISGLANDKYADWFNFTTVGTGGSQENAVLIGKNEADLGCVFTSEMYEAYFGVGGFEGKQVPNMRLIGVIELSPIHTIAADPNIKSFADMVGKRVAIGNQGMGTAATADKIFTLLNLKDKVNFQYLSMGESADPMKDGNCDVMMGTTGYPHPAAADVLHSLQGAHLVDAVDELTAAGFFTKYPYYGITVIPANTYEQQPNDVRVPSVCMHFVCRADLPEDAVYMFTKMVYENGAYLKTISADMGSVDNPEVGLSNAFIPLHPGAARYWTEKGIAIPDSAKPID